MGDPELVLLDEPMNGLDPAEMVNLRTLLQNRREGQTLVISSHLLTEIEAVCDHIAFVEQGRTVRQDRLEDIREETTRIQYRIDGGTVPMDALRSALPEVRFAHAFDQSTITATYADNDHSAAKVNRTVLHILLEAGVDVLDIQRGTDLESAYLHARKS
jgi:ABC-2 type transport system ATP-binding protein